MRLGIGSFTYGWAVGIPGQKLAEPLDEMGLLEKAREANVTVIQIGDNLPLHTFDRARLERLRNRSASEGIEIQVGARRLTREQLKIYSDIANTVGAKLVRFVIDDGDYRPSPESVADILRDFVPLLDGLTVGIENHDRFPASVLREIIEAVDSQRVGVCLDTANSLGAGEGLDTILPHLAPFTVNLHLKDFRVTRVSHQMGFSVSGTPAGEGLMRAPHILKELETFGRCDSAILEQWTPPEATLDATVAKEAAWASQSLKYLKRFFH